MSKSKQPDTIAASRARATPATPSEPAAVWVPIASLTPWARNPRRNDAAVAKVVESIRRFGFASPIIARKADGEVIAGHTRLRAAAELGLEQVPVRYLDLDPADAHLLALADNKIGEVAEWDDATLLELLGDLRQEGVDAAAVAGWSDVEIDGLLKSAGDEVLGGGDGVDLGEDESAKAATGFAVLIECESETEQVAVIERAQEEGWKCRALT